MATSVNRLVGRYAVCTIQAPVGTFVLNLTDWRVNLRTDFVDGTGFGDLWDNPVPIKYLWTARVRGFFSGTNSYLQSYLLPVPNVNDIVPVTLFGYTDDTQNNLIFNGQGFIEGAAFMAPQTMAEQELEIRSLGPPSMVK